MPPLRGAEALSVGLGGHAVGNLLLAALVALEHGDFEEGVREMNRVLAVRGRVVPATGTVLNLHARLRDGTEVEGQSLIARSDDVDRVWVTPGDVRASADALRAIEEAEIDRHRPGQPVHEHPAGAAGARDPRGDRRVGRAGRVRLQRRDPGRRDGRLRPCRSLRRARAPRRRAPAGRRAREQPVRRRRRPPAGWASRSGSAGRPPASAQTAPRLVLDDLVDPGNAHHHDPARLAGCGHAASGSARAATAAGPPMARVGRAS